MITSLDEMYELFRRHRHDGIESERLTLRGIVAPAFRPTDVGIIYCDTANAKVYISTGTTDSNDWRILN